MSKKKVTFATVISIIFAVTSLGYVITACVYIIHMLTLLIKHSELDMMAFLFELIGLPLILVFIFVPIVRIVAMILSITSLKKLKAETLKHALNVVSGLLQILDALVSPIAYIGLLFYVTGYALDSQINKIFDEMYFLSGDACDTIRTILFVLLCIPVFVKGIIQIVSAIMLFTAKKAKPALEEE